MVSRSSASTRSPDQPSGAWPSSGRRGGDPFTQPHQSDRRPSPGGDAVSGPVQYVVASLDAGRSRTVTRACLRRVLARVGQRLLHDPVRRPAHVTATVLSRVSFLNFPRVLRPFGCEHGLRDMPHDSCRRSVEVLTVRPICCVILEHSDVSLVYEGGRLKRMIWPLQLHLVERDPMKVVVDQIEPACSGLLVPLLELDQYFPGFSGL